MTDWLIVWLALAMGIVAVFPRAMVDVIVAFPLVSAAIIWFAGDEGSGAEGRLPPRWVTGLLLVLATIVTCCFGSFYVFAVDSQPLQPSSSELLPLPDGLQATSNIGGDDHCGTGVCSRWFTIAGLAGQPPEEVRDRVWRHLSRKGWELDNNGQDCRPAGLLLDQRTICVSVCIRDGVVNVHFEGSEAWA